MNKSSERYQMKTPLTIYVHNAQGEQIFCFFYICLSIYLSVCLHYIPHLFNSSLRVLIFLFSLSPIKLTILLS